MRPPTRRTLARPPTRRTLARPPTRRTLARPPTRRCFAHPQGDAVLLTNFSQKSGYSLGKGQDSFLKSPPFLRGGDSLGKGTRDCVPPSGVEVGDSITTLRPSSLQRGLKGGLRPPWRSPPENLIWPALTPLPPRPEISGRHSIFDNNTS
jgi:hypothetical protein